MLRCVVKASHLMSHRLRIHMRRLHPWLVHAILRGHTVTLEMWVLNVGSHRSVHIWSHRKLIHVWRSTVLWHRVPIIVVLTCLRMHPRSTVDSCCWLLMIPRSTIEVWLTLHITLWTHLLIPSLASARCYGLVSVETCRRWLVPVCVVTWLSPLCCIVQSDRSRKYELTLHLCDSFLGLIRRCEP